MFLHKLNSFIDILYSLLFKYINYSENLLNMILSYLVIMMLIYYTSVQKKMTPCAKI